MFWRLRSPSWRHWYYQAKVGATYRVKFKTQETRVGEERRCFLRFRCWQLGKMVEYCPGKNLLALRIIMDFYSQAGRSGKEQRKVGVGHVRLGAVVLNCLAGPRLRNHLLWPSRLHNVIPNSAAVAGMFSVTSAETVRELHPWILVFKRLQIEKLFFPG